MTLEVDDAPVASHLPPVGHGQDPENRLEEILVYRLLDEVIESLTDRAGNLHRFPWSPDQEVRIGVLGATYSPQAPVAPWGGGAAAVGTAVAMAGGAGTNGVNAPIAAVTQAVDNRGVIGLDFVIEGGALEASSSDNISLRVDVDYAIYHPEVQEFDAVQLAAQGQAQAVAGNAKRRPRVTIRPNWRRDNRHVSYSVRVPADTGDTPVLSSNGSACPFEADAQASVAAHYAGRNALWKLSNNQTLPVNDALGTEAQFRQALDGRRDPAWQPTWPQPELSVSTMQMINGDVAVSVSLVNRRVVTEKFGDVSVYDARLSVCVERPALKPQVLGFAQDDLRYEAAATVVGRGRGCVAAPGENEQTIVAETLPIQGQARIQARSHGVDLSFAGLAAEHEQKLAAVGSAMRGFLRSWDLGGATGARLQQLEQRREAFEAETERFELGCDLLKANPWLRQAFELANRSFADAKGPGAAWYLFQLVFIVSELGALAGREDPTDPLLRRELDAVDVLWFPTGGGKTEAYLGLILVGLFFDRLRGKLRGTTAWMLFPLRMLSVQQLVRISEVIHWAEQLREAGEIPGDPFTLGYLVGKINTPNRLAKPDGWWPGLDAFSKRPESERDIRRIVGACPACGELDSVGLDGDVANMRMVHVCRSCGHRLAVYMSDEEVYRYQPSVLVSTVDKITAFARQGEFTAFNRGPRKLCPQHGWYTHERCVASDCGTDPSTHADATGFYDATPALWIQDELHLVREDLGVFASHYHTLIAELARGADHEPSKVIAATATIEQYEDQLSQLYGRNPRMFPVGGPTLAQSFYTEVTEDARRVYLGVMPAGGGTAKVDLAGQITCQLIEAIHRSMDDPAPFIGALKDEGIEIDEATARAHLLDYELTLAYVNSKAHGVTILDDIQRLSEDLHQEGSERVEARYVMGETPLSELASLVAAVQSDSEGVPRAQRVRAMVGTAVVSHGVDLDRLNLEVMVGMPSAYAMYIQAASRAGRRHVGTVISVFDRNNRRETSMYQSFLTTHRALERMVEPVPVNRFATRAVERTLPGIICALLWDETRNPAWPSTDAISTTRRFRPWWNTVSATLEPHLRTRIEAAYRCPVPLASMQLEEQKLLGDAVRRWDVIERQRMQQWQAEWLSELFTSQAMTSLRDVDPAVKFSAGGNRASRIASRLTGGV